MGLGLNGGGYESARFFARNGAVVTATDLRDEATLAPTIEKLKDLSIRYVLGKHEIQDFVNADVVIKNPAVKWDSPFLKAAVHIETDISVFLKMNDRPVIAVTGSKGKSTTVSALHFAMKEQFPGCDLGGNITVSPLSFCEHETDDPVILELSSWQLADIRDLSILKPSVSLITNIMHDHMNHYSSVREYAEDKKRIFASQDKTRYTLCNFDDPWGREFFNETPGTPVYFSSSSMEQDGAFLEGETGYMLAGGSKTEILPSGLKIPGSHNRINLLSAAACGFLFGVDSKRLKEKLGEFSGIPHRMELVRTVNGIAYYNDSAATIPQAAAMAVSSFGKPVHIICGGTDKECDFKGFAEALRTHRIFLLEGTATDIIRHDLEKLGITYAGPFSSLKMAFDAAGKVMRIGDTLILSPGATSFGMFLNEFDRGNQFKELVNGL